MTVAAPTLRPYQIAALEAISAAQAGGQNRLLIKSPTGTGKTVGFAAMPEWPALKAWLGQFPKHDRRMLVIAHREELLTQAAEKIHRANPTAVVSIEQGEMRASAYTDVIVASIQTLAAMKFRRLKKILAWGTPRIVVVDEAHHAAARTYRAALALLGFLPLAAADPLSDDNEIEAVRHDDVAKMAAALQDWDKVAPRDRLLVGVTATPNRSDAIGLGCVFSSIAYSYDLKTAIDDQWLVPIESWSVDTSTSLDDVRTTAGDFNQKQLAHAVNTPQRNLLAVKAWQEYAEGLSTLAFSVDVAHAQELARAFQSVGVSAAAVSGETPKDERRGLLQRFSRGELTVLTNCMVLTEGTDLPRTECILHAKPTQSATLYEQMSGRGLRLFPPHKRRCVLIDLVDLSRKHSLQSAPVLYGLPPNLKMDGKNLRQMADDLEAFKEKYQGFDVESAGRLTLEQLRVLASRVDVWEVPTLGAFGNGRALTWIKAGADEYRLQYPWGDGLEVLTVARNLLTHYDVSVTLHPRDGSAKRQRTIATEIPTADAAAGLAEKFVLAERRAVTKLKDRDAPWRTRPASEKQIGLLRRLRIPVKPGMLAGTASDMIDLHRARRA